MVRWVGISMVALMGVVAGSSSASTTPTTRPVVAVKGQTFDFAQQSRELQQQWHDLSLQMGQLRAAPEFQFDMKSLPMVKIRPYEVKPGNITLHDLTPYGTPFPFNGLTVYVEPVEEAVFSTATKK